MSASGRGLAFAQRGRLTVSAQAVGIQQAEPPQRPEQSEILGPAHDPLHQTGAVYTFAPSTAMPAVGQWHTFEIEAKGKTITTRIDGQQVSQLANANRSPKGYIGLQNHDGNSRVQFARLRIKKLP